MRSDVHHAALEVAAKLAFSVVLLNGCSGASALAGGAEGADGDEAASNESAIAARGSSTPAPKKADAKKPVAKQPCPEEDAGPAKPSCDVVLASAFPTPGDYQWEPVAQSKEVVACCDEELTNKGSSSTYRWDCCVAYDPEATPDPNGGFANPQHGMACTPWGPPVPPSMKRARRPMPRLAQAVA